MRQEDDRGGPQDTGKAQEPEGPAEKAGSKKDKYQKAQAQAERTGEKLGKAREKLDKAEAKRAAQKPPGLAKKAVRGVRTEAWFYLHNKIHEVEHENVGVEGAHKSELTAEAGTRKLARYAKRRWREHPARKVGKWERKDIKARANVDFQKMAAEHPELASNPLSRIQQKWKLKRRYSKEAKTAAKQSAKAAKKAAAASGNVTLTNKTLPAVILPRLNEQQREIYTVMQQLKGNKPYLWEGIYTGGEDTGPSYEIPGEALDDPVFAALMAEATKYIGWPYVWGGSSPSTSFDCSGFVCWVYTASGVHNLPRTTAQGIYNQCAIISPSEAKPGDIIFFTGTYDSPGPVSHVGIYVGDGMMLHCGSPIQYANINSSYWQTHFYAFGRL